MINEYYYLNGYFVNEYINDLTGDNLLELTNHFINDPLKDGWSWEEKYKKTFDLKPNAYSYDTLLLDLIFDNKIPDVLMNALGYHPLLVHLQVRHVLPGANYMPWHRDVYKYNNSSKVGLMPNPHKLMIYPKTNASSATLSLVPGSHRRFFKHKFLDKLQIYFSSKGVIHNSNSSYTILDTSIIHNTIQEENKRGSIRYIYVFGSEVHLKFFEEMSDLHKLYRKRLNDYLYN